MNMQSKQISNSSTKLKGNLNNISTMITLSHPGTLTPIIQLHNLLTQQLANGEYLEITRRYKQTSYRLKYLINHLHLKIEEQLTNTNKYALKSLVRDCIKIVKILVMSTQYQKYGHVLSLFDFIVRKWEEIGVTKSTPILFGNAQKNFLLDRITKNEDQQLYNNMDRTPRTINQIQILQDPNLNNWIKTLTSSRALVQNPQCINCSRLFTKSQEIINRNPCFPNIIRLNMKVLLISSELKRYINAISNSGGGVIFFGAQKRDSGFFATGLKQMMNQNANFGFCLQKNQISENTQVARGSQIICEQIRESLQVIQEHANCYVEKVLIQSPISQSTHKLQKASNICLRITIQPHEPKKMNYLEQTKYDQTNYQMYQIDSKNSKHLKIPSSPLEDRFFNIYSIIHKNYKKYKNVINSHKNIKCFLPISFMDYQTKLIKEFLDDSYQQVIQSEAKYIIDNDNQKEDEPVSDYYAFSSLEPHFRYEKTTLVVARSEKYRKQILFFYDFLKKLKYQVEISSPYKSYFEKSEPRYRPIFMLSHQMNQKQLSDRLDQYEASKNMQKGIVILLPVQKTLQVQFSKLTVKKQKQIRQKYLLKYNESQIYKVQRDSIQSNISGKIKNFQSIYFLTCQDFSQAIFLYMLLEESQIRPYFVEEGIPYKKKSK